MYQPYCGVELQLVWSAQQIVLLVPSRTPVLELKVSVCCCSAESGMLVGGLLRPA